MKAGSASCRSGPRKGMLLLELFVMISIGVFIGQILEVSGSIAGPVGVDPAVDRTGARSGGTRGRRF